MTKREKNNIARMLCYEKHKIKQEADQYEKYMIYYHFTKYNDITYHWKNIPEEWLFESGYIHSYNELRKKRLLQQTNNCIGEYGLDGMTYNKKLECYQGLQAKHYNEKNTLTANCLGTFLSSIMCIFLKSNKLAGIVYHTCKLQIDFKQNTQQCNSIYKTEKLDFNKIDIKQKPFKLRDYQIDAINNCKKYNNGIYLTRMACGTGKTTIFSHLAKSYNKIICISPLKILVDKNHNCILNNLNDYDYDNAIFDSDHNNEIDEQTINDFLKKDKYLISTTFKTARDVFSKIDFSDYNILLIIDEGHNLYDEDKIWDIAKNINNSHIFTGTKTEELENNITEEINYLSLGDAIQQKLICDYQIYLPLNIDGKIDVNYEENEIIEQSDVETKIMFILKGLLFAGSKRCIIYLTSKQDIFDYEELMIQKAESFHGIKLNTFKIYESVTPNKRKTEIEGFESNINSNELNIMFSIRILDEGIDIVKCDSIFITNITDNTSEKRTVQRMCRANRLNEDNPCKIANIFIWTDDKNKICNMLNYLKLEDPTFSSKIRSITVDYDTAGTKREIEKENTILNKLYFNTKCVTLSELFEIKFEIWNSLTIERGELVKKREIINHETYGEINIGLWQHSQKQKWNKNQMTEIEKIKFLANPHFKQWTEEENKRIPQDIKFKIWNNLTIEENRLVKDKEVINDETYGEINIGIWQDTQKRKWNKNQMTENEKIKFLANIHFKEWTKQEKKEKKKIPQETLFQLWNDLTIKREELIKQTEVINHENYGQINIGKWQNTQKQKWNKNQIKEIEKIKFLGNPYFKAWTEQEKKEIPQETLFQLWNDLTIKRGELIKKTEIIKQTEVINHENYGQINIGIWQDTQKQKWNKNQMTENEKIKFLANIHFKEWTKQEKKEKKKIPQETLFQLWNDLTIKREELIKQTEVINHENYGQIDIGKWQYRKKKTWTKNQMTENEKIKFLANIHFKEWTEEENKRIPQETLFQLWNVLTIKRGELIKQTEVINHENYGQINIGKWQSTQKQKWTKNQMTENEKIKFLANIHFKEWTEEENKRIPQETLFQLWNDLTIKRGELIKQTEIINHNNYGQINIGKWQNTQKQKWTKNQMTENEKIKFLANPYFKEWTQKKQIKYKNDYY